MTALSQNPVWLECPPLCQKSWLPSLQTLPDLLVFLARNGPRCEVLRVYQCNHCRGWHAETSGPDPAGNTSGTTRYQKHKDD